MPSDSWTTFVNARRLKVYSWIFIGLYVVLALVWLGLAENGIDPKGKPLGYDFITFYAAAGLALQGQAAQAFSAAAIFAAEQAAVPANAMLFLWHYPPTFHLLVTPLGLLPYGAAFAVFVAATFAVYLAMMRWAFDHRLTLLLACAFPPVFVNAFHGQSAFLHAGLMGFGLLALERRPLLAGAALGLLAYKPHLGVLLPFLLLAGGHYRALAAAAVSASVLVGLATAIFGIDYWHAFFGNLPLTAEILEKGMLPWSKMPSVFAAASLLGAPPITAYGLQAASTAVIAFATAFAWRRSGPLDLKAALAVVAACCMSPYLFDYDLVLLAIPVGVLARRAAMRGDGGLGAILVLVSLLPLCAPAVAEITPVQLMTAGLFVLYAAAWRMFFMTAEAQATARPPVPAEA